MTHIIPDVKTSPETGALASVKDSVEKAIEAAVVSPVARQVAELVQLSEVPLLERSRSVDVPVDPKSLDAPSALAEKSLEEIKAIMNAKGILSRGDFDKICFYKKAVALCDGGKMYAVYDAKEGMISLYKTDTKAFVNKVSLTLKNGFYIEDLVDLSHEHNHPLKEGYLLMEVKQNGKMVSQDSDRRINLDETHLIIFNLKDKAIKDLTPGAVLKEINESLELHKATCTGYSMKFAFPKHLDQDSQKSRKTFEFYIVLQLNNCENQYNLDTKTFVCSYNLESQISQVLYTLPFFAFGLVLSDHNQIAFYAKLTEEVDYDQGTVLVEAYQIQDDKTEMIWSGFQEDTEDSLICDTSDPDSPFFLERNLGEGNREFVLRSLRSNQVSALLSDLERHKLKSKAKNFKVNPRDLKELIFYETSYDEKTFHVKLPNGSFETMKASMIHVSPLFQDPDFLTHLVQKLDIKAPYMFNFSTRMFYKFFLLSPATETSPVKFELIYRKHVLEDFEPEVSVKCSVPQSFTFKARDGLELQGYLTLPVKKAGKNLPALLLVHGGPAIRDKLLIDDKVQAWASRGVAVVQLNFRGSGGFGMSFEKAGEGEWNRKMTDDLIDGLNHWIQKGVIDPAKIVAYGGSYGAFAVASCLTRYPGFFTCGIVFNGEYDLLGDVSAFDSKNKREQYSRDYGVSIAEDNSVSEQDLEKLRQSSPHYALEQLTKPLLIISGAADDVCDPEQSHALAKRAEGLGKSVLHVEFDDAGHSLDTVKSDAGQLHKLQFGLCENFVSRYLPEIFAEPVSADFVKEKTAHIIRSTL